MKDRTTLQVPRALLKRLRAHGRGKKTNAEILKDLLDNQDRTDYLRTLRREVQDATRLIPHGRV